MDDLINRVVEKADVSEEVAKSAIAVILNFLSNDGPEDKVNKLIESLPGSSELMKTSPDSGESGLMGTFNELIAAGLEMGNVQTVSKEIISFAKEKAGEELVDEIVDGISGLSQFV